MGMEVLPSDSQTIGVLATRLREGHLVALVADRDLSKSGIEVQFFDGPTRMPAGPAVLALQTQAPLITAFVSYTPTGIHVEFKNVLIPSEGEDRDRVKEIVSMTAKHFEEGIRNNPQDWHMLQRIWTDGDFKERQ
jgi:KDO2-lipid IV(A) lauroyltransferase